MPFEKGTNKSVISRNDCHVHRPVVGYFDAWGVDPS